MMETDLFVIRAVESRGEPCRLGVGHLAELSGLTGLHLGLLALDLTDLKTCVAWFEKDLVPMKLVERVRGVLTSYLLVE